MLLFKSFKIIKDLRYRWFNSNSSNLKYNNFDDQKLGFKI